MDLVRKLTEYGNTNSIRLIHQALGADVDVYLIGGSIRDCALGENAVDFDLTCKLQPQEIIERLLKANIKVIPTGIKHQTVTAIPIEGEKGIEITTFRNLSDKTSRKSLTLETDLSFRDFTINSIAFSLVEHKLIDPNNGLVDIRNRIIRTVGNAKERFTEDPLRVLRMIRFSCSNNFIIEKETLLEAYSVVEKLKDISIERIRDEISKILLSDKPADGFRLLNELKILQIVLPEVARYVGFEQNQFHKADLFEHTLEVISRTPKDLVLKLAALFHDVAKPDTLSIDPETKTRHFFKHETVGLSITASVLSRLRYPNSIIEQVNCLISTHMRPIECGVGGLRRILRDTGNLFDKWRIFKEADALSCNIDEKIFLEKLKNFDMAMEEVKKGPNVSPLKSLAVNGNDLLALGFKKGPIIGETLRKLHELVLDNPELNNKEALLHKAKENLL